VRELQAEGHEVSLYGTGGPNLLALGQVQYSTVADMMVIGFDKAILKIPMLMRLAKQLEKAIYELKPDLILTVDYNGFNLRFAKRLKNCPIPIVQFVSPQYWVWQYSRAYTLRDYFDKVLCILPFEEKQLRDIGVNAVYIGNPVVDNIKYKHVDKASFFAAHGLQQGKLTIGLVPGSRPVEVGYMLPVMAEAARRLGNTAQFVLAKADVISTELLESHTHGLDVKIIAGETHDIMANSDILWICSGTATLEAGIIGTPMIIMYNSSPFNLFVIGRLTKLRMFGLPNIIAGRYVLPELLRKTLTPEILLEKHTDMIGRLGEVHESLKYLNDMFGGMNPIRNAAGEILKTINENEELINVR
jgi:lipid-A-disaccharide synthase